MELWTLDYGQMLFAAFYFIEDRPCAPNSSDIVYQPW